VPAPPVERRPTDEGSGGMNDVVRVGMVGAGFIAEQHLANLVAFDDVVVAGVADVDASRADALARQHGVPPYASHEALLADGRLDALYVCVPPFAHGAIERAAVEADLALFVEKPVALDLATAESIEAAISERGVVNATGYHWRYLDVVERAKAALEGHAVHLVMGYWLDVLPPPAWWTQRSRSGGQMVEQTTHVFDLTRFLVGDVARVQADVSTLARPAYADCDIDWAATATLRFENGAVGCVASTCVLPHPHRIGLHVFADGLAVELSERDLVVDDGNHPARYEASVDPFVREDRDFVDAARGGPNRIRAPYGEAVATHRLAVAAARSAAAGEPIDPRATDAAHPSV
jgi:predicted dehydrogenase